MMSDWGLDAETIAGGHPGDELDYQVAFPSTGGIYEIRIALGFDGKVIVIDGAEEFTAFVAEDDGSYYFREGILGPMEPGVYLVKVRFNFEHGRGEAGSHDPGCDDMWFEEIAWSVPGGPWIDIGAVPA